MSSGLRIVADASAVLAAMLPEVHTDEACALLASASEIHAPDLLPYEVVSALRMRVVRGDLTDSEAQTKLHEARALPVLLTSARQLDCQAFALASALRHSTYDCFCLALALELDCELVTGDRRLAKRTREAGVGAHVRVLGG